MWVYACECQCPQRPEDRGTGFPMGEVTVSCEPYNIVSGKQSGVFCKHLPCSYPLSLLASPITPVLTR